MSSAAKATAPLSGVRVGQVVARFADAWQRGQRPRLEEYLPPDETRPAVLLELVRADLVQRHRAGESVRVEHYLEQFPELARDGGAVLDLLAAEFDCRQARENALAADEFGLRVYQLGKELLPRLRASQPAPVSIIPERPVLQPVDRRPLLLALAACCAVLVGVVFCFAFAGVILWSRFSSQQALQTQPAPAPQTEPARDDRKGGAEVTLLLKEGLDFHNGGEYERALAAYDKAIQLNPEFALAWYRRGATFMQTKAYDRAIANLSEAIRLDADLAWAYLDRGHCYAQLDFLDKAIADFNEALDIDPDYILAYENRAWVYNRKLEYDKAIADYDQVLRLNPDRHFSRIERGWTYIQKKEYDKAIADLDLAVRLDPGNKFGFFNRGHAYFQKGELDKALPDLDLAIRLDPNYGWSYFVRSQVHAKKGNQERSDADYEKAIALDPSLKAQKRP